MRTTVALLILTSLVGAGCKGKSIPGDPARFDPVASLGALKKIAGDGYALVEIDAGGVRPDGTVNMKETSFNPEVEYVFERKVDPPADQPPIGAGGSLSKVWKSRVRLEVERPGYHETYRSGSERRGYRTRGVNRYGGDPEPGAPADPVPDPGCSFAQIWKAVSESPNQEIPAGAVASIDFDASGYSFAISGTKIRADFKPDCTPK